jgi:hypothetical protein
MTHLAAGVPPSRIMRQTRLHSRSLGTAPLLWQQVRLRQGFCKGACHRLVDMHVHCDNGAASGTVNASSSQELQTAQLALAFCSFMSSVA